MSFPAVVSKPPPGRGWYVVAGLLLIATAAAMALFIYSRISGLAAELVQVVVPGQADLNLRETGTYTVFHEYRSVVDGKVYYAASLSGLHMTVRSPSGTLLNLVSPTATSRYSFNGRAGISILAFDVTEPGVHHLIAWYENGRSEPLTVLTVGSGFVAGILITVFVALAIAFSGIGVAVAIIVVVALARRRALRPTVAAR